MSDKFLDRYVGRNGPGMALDRTDAADAVDNVGCFGVLRGVRERSPSLELRRKTGNVLVVSWGWVESMELDLTEGIVLRLGGKNVRLKGRNLGGEVRPNVRLISALAAHRVAWVQEIAKSEVLVAGDGTPVVEAIDW